MIEAEAPSSRKEVSLFRGGINTCEVYSGTALVVVLLVALTSEAHAGDWPHWRGPSRNDIIADGSGFNGGRWVDRKWVWEAQAGEGSTSPLIVDGRLYVLGWDGGNDHVRCLEAKTGKPLWDATYQCPRSRPICETGAAEIGVFG